MTYLKLKYGIDRFVALFLILILLPLILIISILVKLKLGSPIFFIQKRPGFKEKYFLLIKFRSMSNRKDKYGKLLKDKFRLTYNPKLLYGGSVDKKTIHKPRGKNIRQFAYERSFIFKKAFN